MPEETLTLARYVAFARLEDLPELVVQRAKEIMLDTLSCAAAGSRKSSEECGWAVALAKELGGRAESTIWFDGTQVSPSAAALANAAMVHTVDFDDTHIDSVAHLGAGLLGAVLALGEALGSSGGEVLTAFVLGFEVAARVGNCVNKGAVHQHYKYWHPTATAGTVGCAAAAARLLGLDAEETEQAIGLGVDQAAGFRYCVDKGDFSKSLHPGWAAMRGILSAQIIRLGASGPKGLLEYPTGFCRAMCPEPRWEELTAGLGERYEILRDALKLYPTIHGSHTGIEATLRLMEAHHLDYRQIRHIRIRLAPLAKGQGVNYRPESVLASRLSIPCCISLAARKGRVTLDDFTEELLSDPEHLAFMQKVEVQPEPQFNVLYPDSGFTGEATITLQNGTQYQQLIPYPKAHPQRPASREELREKFRMLAENAWSPDRTAEVEACFASLESCPDVRALVALFQEGTPV